MRSFVGSLAGSMMSAMKKVCKFLRFSPMERRLLIRAVLLVGAVRLGLWVLAFERLRNLLVRVRQRSVERNGSDQVSVDEIVWAVTLASRYVPRATCLTQALAGQVLLARWGHRVELFIGVARGPAGSLEAHAWLESCGRVVIGDLVNLSRYIAFPSLKW